MDFAAASWTQGGYIANRNLVSCTFASNILTHLNKNCIQISFPYIYFACLYPLYSDHPAAEIDGGNTYDISKVVNTDVVINLKKNIQIMKLLNYMIIN